MSYLSKKHAVIAGLVCGAISVTSFAQSGVIEEIVVTATKRVQTLQETPVAVTVVSAEAIEKAQILDISDLQSVVPSLRVSTLQSSTNTSFFIRGFGNGANNPGIEPSVGVFVDGVYRSRSAGAIGDLPSLERVEVLNGPQSTLFGKNASAGVISVITAKPTGEPGGKVSASFGNRDTVILKGEVEGAISDTAAFKISGGINSKDGYVTNQVTGNDINNRDRYNIRGDLLLNPNDNLEIRVIADFDNIDEECCATVNLFAGPTLGAIQAAGGDLIANDDDSRTQLTNIDPTNQQDNYGISAQVDYDFGNVTLTSITSYREIDTFSDIDADFTSTDISTNDIQSDIETLTQEFRLTGSAGDNFDWQVGAFYFDEDIQTENNLVFGSGFRPYVNTLIAGGAQSAAVQGLSAAGISPTSALGASIIGGAVTDALTGFATLEGAVGAPFFAAGSGVSDVGTLENESISFFGQFDYHVSDKTTLSLGLNFTNDEKDATVIQSLSDVFSSVNLDQLVAFGLIDAATADGLSPLQFLPPLDDLTSDDPESSTDDDELTYTLKLAYDFSDSLSSYVSYGTGFKASSFNLSRDSAPGLRFADPEEAEVFEFGLKGRFNRGSFNLAIFDQTLEDFQSNTFVGTGFFLTNSEEQSVLGAEFDISYYPTDALELKFAATLLDPEFDSFQNGPAVELDSGDPESVDLSGQSPAGIHDVSFSIAAIYNFNIGSNDAFIRGDFFYEDEVQLTENVPGGSVTFANGTVADIGAVQETKNLNLSAGITTQNGLSVSLWGRNVTDNDTLQSSFPGIAQLGTFNGYRNEPRTYGVSISKDF